MLEKINQYIKENAEEYVDSQTDEINLTLIEEEIQTEFDLSEDEFEELDLSWHIYSVLDELGYIYHNTGYYPAEIQ